MKIKTAGDLLTLRARSVELSKKYWQQNVCGQATTNGLDFTIATLTFVKKIHA